LRIRCDAPGGGRPLYVCFNRPLADHFAQIAPRGGVAATLHMLCDQFLRDHGITPDFHRPQAFERLVEEAAALPIRPGWQFDSVIVDEGQDFRVEWRDLVFRHARDNARILWLEDPMQNLYDLPEVPLPGWVRLRANSNYRSPRGVVQILSTLLPEGEAIEAAGPFLEADVDVLTYADGAGLAAQVKEGLRQCQAAGYRPEDIAIVTFRGREQSGLFAYTQLGPPYPAHLHRRVRPARASAIQRRQGAAGNSLPVQGPGGPGNHLRRTGLRGARRQDAAQAFRGHDPGAVEADSSGVQSALQRCSMARLVRTAEKPG
jgi:hypothetical protein